METNKLKQVGGLDRPVDEDDYEDSIIKTIVELMNKVECVLDMNGLDKKNYVLNETRKLLGLEVYERYSYFIITFIDFVVDVSKGKSGIEVNKIKKKFKCCYI